MRVVVNGTSHELEERVTLAALLEQLGLRLGFGAIEVNREVVPRSEHGTRLLADGDVVEIVRFVGGG